MVTSIINEWAAHYGIFAKRIASDRFIAVLNESILAELEQKRFSILDVMRERTMQKNLSLTLSIGIVEGYRWKNMDTGYLWEALDYTDLKASENNGKAE